MFILTKLLTNLILPLGSAFLIFFVGIFKKEKNYLFLSFFLIYFFSNRIVSNKIQKFVEKPWHYIGVEKVSKANAIVVLSGGLKENKLLDNNFYEWNDPDRFFAGLRLINSGKSDKIIFTGGINPIYQQKENEGEKLKQEAIRNNIDASKIILSHPVTNTYEEAKAVKKIFEENYYFSNKASNIILVTSAMHMQRAKNIFEKRGFNVTPFPVDFKTVNIDNFSLLKSPLTWIPSAKSLFISTKCLRELIARLIYGA